MTTIQTHALANMTVLDKIACARMRMDRRRVEMAYACDPAAWEIRAARWRKAARAWQLRLNQAGRSA